MLCCVCAVVRFSVLLCCAVLLCCVCGVVWCGVTLCLLFFVLLVVCFNSQLNFREKSASVPVPVASNKIHF